MTRTPEVVEKAIVCDEGNNPPSVVAAGVLNIDIRIKLVGSGCEHHAFRLPIDLTALKEGKLTHVSVVGLGE